MVWHYYALCTPIIMTVIWNGTLLTDPVLIDIPRLDCCEPYSNVLVLVELSSLKLDYPAHQNFGFAKFEDIN